jgi:cyanate permease
MTPINATAPPAGPGLATATRAITNWMPVARWSFAQGLAHAFSRVANSVTPPFVAFLVIAVSWRGSFIVVGALSFAWVIIWVWYFRDNPADHKDITSEELAELSPVALKKNRVRVPVWRLIQRLLPVMLTDFCYGWTLWVCLNWLPSFFRENYGLALESSALFTAGIFLAGIVGDTLGGVISDRILIRTGSLVRARRNLIVAGLVGSMVFFLPVLAFHDLALVSISLTLAFFFMELVIAPLWSVPMDIAPGYSGTASGFMNFGAAVAGIISPWVFGRIIDLSGSWSLPFAFSVALMLLGAVAAFWMRPEKPFVDNPASGTSASRGHEGETCSCN